MVLVPHLNNAEFLKLSAERANLVSQSELNACLIAPIPSRMQRVDFLVVLELVDNQSKNLDIIRHLRHPDFVPREHTGHTFIVSTSGRSADGEPAGISLHCTAPSASTW